MHWIWDENYSSDNRSWRSTEGHISFWSHRSRKRFQVKTNELGILQSLWFHHFVKEKRDETECFIGRVESSTFVKSYRWSTAICADDIIPILCWIPGELLEKDLLHRSWESHVYFVSSWCVTPREIDIVIPLVSLMRSFPIFPMNWFLLVNLKGLFFWNHSTNTTKVKWLKCCRRTYQYAQTFWHRTGCCLRSTERTRKGM